MELTREDFDKAIENSDWATYFSNVILNALDELSNTEAGTRIPDDVWNSYFYVEEVVKAGMDHKDSMWNLIQKMNKHWNMLNDPDAMKIWMDLSSLKYYAKKFGAI